MSESTITQAHYHAFRSHNTTDKPLVEQVGEELERRGLSCWSGCARAKRLRKNRPVHGVTGGTLRSDAIAVALYLIVDCGHLLHLIRGLGTYDIISRRSRGQRNCDYLGVTV